MLNWILGLIFRKMILKRNEQIEEGLEEGIIMIIMIMIIMIITTAIIIIIIK